MSNFVVSKDKFVNNFVTPLSRFDLTDKPAQVFINDNNLTGVTHSDDRSVILEATLKDIKGDDTDPFVLKDLNRLLSALGFVQETMMTFDVEPNHLLYKDDAIRFKSFFLDNRFFDDKIPLKLEKIKEQTYDHSFTLSQDSLAKIRKSAQFVGADTSKVYLSGNSKDGVVASRHDASKTSIDTISFNIVPEYTGTDFTPIPLHIDLFSLISEKDCDILVEINDKFGLFLLTVETDEYKLQYITTALRK
jgi:hypothetical protein|tara:strand:+ start:49349 stop:50092 length:744 start_codon:yes stop_codon:yes gene_type:complete